MDEFEKIKDKYSEVLIEFNKLIASEKENSKLIEEIGLILAKLDDESGKQVAINKNLAQIEETLTLRLEDTKANVTEASNIVGQAKNIVEKINENNEKSIVKIEVKITDLQKEIAIVKNNVEKITENYIDINRKISLIKEVKKAK
jgi:ABC-type transporter Mla subunit MlaD|tara:strand:- start:2018 stop:2452 length:435 start_codon:yes stop_codon:yes gene_type:complete